jgi:hypothetical protein
MQLCGCETSSLTLRKECRLRVFNNRVWRNIVGTKKDRVTEEWRRLHDEELYDQYTLPNITWVIKSRRMRWAGHVACIRDRRGAYRALLGRSEGKRPDGRLSVDGRIILK